MSRARLLAVLACAALLAASCTDDPTGAAREPSASTPAADTWIVAMGDSYISGEGARWAANTSGAARPVDALGPRAYADQGRRESEPGCHRSTDSEAQISEGVKAATLACSGAKTASSSSGGTFKPGLDFFDSGSGDVGQAAALQELAAAHDVSAVVVSIGGNDFGFASVVGQCVSDFISTVGQRPRYCHDEPVVRERFSSDQEALIQNRIVNALRNVVKAMQRAGHPPSDYQLVVQTYPSPIPPGPRLRYAETIVERGLVGGCPFFSADATWANATALATINRAVTGAAADAGFDNISVLDLSDALVGHRLCEKGAALFDPDEFGSWRDDGVADAVEWVNRIYTGSRPWQLQESLHPNYWGVLAARAELAELLTQ